MNYNYSPRPHTRTTGIQFKISSLIFRLATDRKPILKVSNLTFAPPRLPRSSYPFFLAFSQACLNAFNTGSSVRARDSTTYLISLVRAVLATAFRCPNISLSLPKHFRYFEFFTLKCDLSQFFLISSNSDNITTVIFDKKQLLT